MDFGINRATAADSRAPDVPPARRAGSPHGELIRAVTFTGTRPELQERLRERRSAGYHHVAIRVAHGHPRCWEEWADVFAGSRRRT
jgi:hypothetical protein